MFLWWVHHSAFHRYNPNFPLFRSINFEEISEKPFTYLRLYFKLCVNIIFPLLIVKLKMEKMASNTGRYSDINAILDIVLEDGEAESDQDLDIDKLSDDGSMIDYEEEDIFSYNKTQQQENPSWRRETETEKVESPDGGIDFESENELDQNRNSIDAGTVDEAIELPLDNDDDQLPKGSDNHCDEEMLQPPKRVKTRGGRMNCGGLHFGNRGCENQVGGGRACGTGAGRELVVLVSVVIVVLALMMA